MPADKPKWGGRRVGHDGKPLGGRPRKTTQPAPTAPAAPKAQGLDHARLADLLPQIIEASERSARFSKRSADSNPFRLPWFPKVAIPKTKNLQMAMDSLPAFAEAGQAWLAGSIFNDIGSEGLLFPGYTYLSQLAQRPEYRTLSETIADDATRKWIDFEVTGNEEEKEERQAQDLADPDGASERREQRLKDKGKTDKVKALRDEMERLKVRDHFYALVRDDGFFGRIHLYLNFGQDLDGGDLAGELKTPIGDGRGALSKGKIEQGSFKSLKVIEPVWTYPTTYNAQNPLAEDWYNPQVWYVMGQEIHATRLLRFMSRPVPDILKPAYSFGGISLSQIAEPYVNIWLQTRNSVAALIHSFSVMVLSTDMQTLLQPGGAGPLLARAALFNALRDNQGLMIVNKTTEDFKNVSASLAGLDDLQAQAQEHVACLPAGTMVETGRGQIPIETVTLKDRVLTRHGFAPIKWIGATGQADTFIRIEADDCVLMATENHPIWSESHQDFVDAANVSPSLRLLKSTSAENTDRLSSGAVVGGGTQKKTTTGIKKLVGCFTVSCGKRIAALFRVATKSITEMMTARTTAGIILSCLPVPSTKLAICASMSGSTPSDVELAEQSSKARSLLNGLTIALRHATTRRSNVGMAGNLSPTPNRASSAPSLSRQSVRTLGSAPGPACSVAVSRVSEIKVSRQPVYNIEVDDGFLPEFYANGILVHNSIARIPLVKYTGLQPKGLNASSEGEIAVYDDTIAAYQNRSMRPSLTTVFNFMQLNLWGEIDPEITFEFEPLRVMTEKEKAEKQKMEAERDGMYLDQGAISSEEIRSRIIADPDLPYTSLNPEDLPEPPDEGMGGEGDLDEAGAVGKGGKTPAEGGGKEKNGAGQGGA